MGIWYASSRRGNAYTMWSPFLTSPYDGEKASMMSNSANIMPSL